MAATTIASVATKLPWKQILLSLPHLADTATELWGQWQSRPRRKQLEPTASIDTKLEHLVGRVLVLEDNERKQSQLVNQIVEQLEGLAVGLEETSARQRRLLQATAASVTLSAIALVVVLVLVFAQ
jgi:hypothetical protein